MTGAKEEDEAAALLARVESLSPRRLVALTTAFIAALSLLVFFQLRQETESRRTETALRTAQAASECAGALNIAIMTGEPVRRTLLACHPGGRAALYHLSDNGDVITAVGATSAVHLDGPTARSLTLSAAERTVLDLPSGKAAAAWRPLDNGEALLVAAPVDDFYNRTPVWLGYALILAAISLVVGSLLTAFLRQSRTALDAAGAVDTLRGYEAALTGGRCCPWFYDGKARTVRFTRSLLEPLGLGARDRYFTLREISALVHPNDLRTGLAILTGDGAGATEGAVRMREPSGGWSRIYLRAAPQAGRLRRSGMAFDLAGAKDASPAVSMAESRLKDAIENIPEAFVLWDGQGRLVAWNRRFSAIFRFADGALAPGLKAAEVEALARARGDIVRQYFAPEAPLAEQSVEVGLPGDRWVQISRRRTSEGGLVCLASNVTDLKRRARAQKRKERELKSTVADLEASRRTLSETMQKYEFEKHRAEEASRSKSEFLANMSHELRTPLNAINGFSEIMRSELYGPLGDAKYKEYVEDILASGRHLLELIDDILDMSKIEAGRIELAPARVELERVLQESIRLVARRAVESGVRLTASVRHAPAIWADARAVKQVTLNLLSNAVKFTPAGGEVTLTAEADLDSVTVIVADSGAGIDRTALARLGAPFAVVGDHFSKSRRGSGIGLALSKSLMELQGGILAIASEPGRGTVACASFPRRQDAKVRLPQFMRDRAHILTGAQTRSEPAPITTEAAE